MENAAFDFDAFIEKMTRKVEEMSYDECIDMALAVCMRDFDSYRKYIDANSCPENKFSVCEEIFAAVLRNRYCPDRMDCKEYINSCNDFLEQLQEEDGEYFDECVNITCMIMHILAYIDTRDKRNITAVLKLCIETGEAYFSRSCPDGGSDKLTELADAVIRLDTSSVTALHSCFDK